MTYFVYRLFDADDCLLYIGCSSNVRDRLRCHSAKEWGSEIASVTVQGPWSRDGARFVESIAIWNEAPRHNIAEQRGPDHSDPEVQHYINDFIGNAYRVHCVYPQVAA